MEEDWTEKYRPDSLKNIVGNGKAVSRLLNWAQSWSQGIPKKRACILSGEPGIGKTSAAISVAKDMGWSVLEMNASDVRSAEKIEKIATRGSLFNTFSEDGSYMSASQGKQKLIIIDEADNLYERVKSSDKTDRSGKDFSDKGGKRAIIKTIRETRQPIVLIVNDLYSLTRRTSLKRMCLDIKFYKIRKPSIEKALKRIIRKEGLEVEKDALSIISQRADGDLRAAINDLQSLSKLGERINGKMTKEIGFRDNSITMYEALSKIFKGEDTEVRKVAWNLDETPDSILGWIDENLPGAYSNVFDLKRGYDALSRADVYLGRVRKRQYYRLWAYASDMMTAGVAVSKNRYYKHYSRYRFPSWIMKMSRTKGMRKARKELSKKIAAWCHTSIKDSTQELLPVFRNLFQGSEKRKFDLAVNMTDQLELTPDEIAFLLDINVDDPKVSMIMEKAVVHREERTGFHASEMRTKKAAASGLDLRKTKKSKKSKKKKSQKSKKKKEAESKRQKSLVDKGKEKKNIKNSKKKSSDGKERGGEPKERPEKAWF